MHSGLSGMLTATLPTLAVGPGPGAVAPRPKAFHALTSLRALSASGLGGSKRHASLPRGSVASKNGRKASCPRAAAASEQYEVADEEGPDTRIPCTILTGFLGSGKTTLLNNILTADHGHRLAVIENEFGEVDVDSDLVAVQEALDPGQEQIIMLNNGCLCCTVRDDLVEMLEQLVLERRGQFDRIIIETTGLANPAPIIQTFFLEESVAEHIRLDGVVTLVDAKHVEMHLDEQKPEGVVNEALEQVAYADRIVLNKTDLVGEEELRRLEARLRGINRLAHIRPAQRAQVPLDYVLGVGGFDLERVEQEVSAKQPHSHAHSHDHERDHDHECGPGCSHHSHGHEHSQSHEHKHEHGPDCGPNCGHEHHHDHKHDDAVSSVSIVLDGDMDLDKVNYWLGALIEMRSEDIYRFKGVLSIKDFDNTFICQGVHMLFEGMPGRPWRQGEKRGSKFVIIGKDLDADLLREGFLECVAK